MRRGASLVFLGWLALSHLGCGTSGDDGAGAGGGDPIEIPMCGPLESRLAGELDGDAFDASFVAEGFARDEGTFVSFGDLGVILLKGESTEDGSLRGDGWLRLPNDATEARGEWFCAGPESHLRITDNDVTGSLTDLSRAGVCPGSPVQGSMTLCVDGKEELCTPSLASDVPLFAFEVAPNMGYFLSGEIGGSSARLEVLVGDGIVVLEIEDLDFNATDVAIAPITPSFVVTPRDVVDAGAVYCTREGSTLEYRIEDGFVLPLRAKLTGLSRLPACDRARGGELGYCMSLTEGD